MTNTLYTSALFNRSIKLFRNKYEIEILDDFIPNINIDGIINKSNSVILSGKKDVDDIAKQLRKITKKNGE